MIANGHKEVYAVPSVPCRIYIVKVQYLEGTAKTLIHLLLVQFYLFLKNLFQSPLKSVERFWTGPDNLLFEKILLFGVIMMLYGIVLFLLRSVKSWSYLN